MIEGGILNREPFSNWGSLVSLLKKFFFRIDFQEAIQEIN